MTSSALFCSIKPNIYVCILGNKKHHWMPRRFSNDEHSMFTSFWRKVEICLHLKKGKFWQHFKRGWGVEGSLALIKQIQTTSTKWIVSYLLNNQNGWIVTTLILSGTLILMRACLVRPVIVYMIIITFLYCYTAWDKIFYIITLLYCLSVNITEISLQLDL